MRIVLTVTDGPHKGQVYPFDGHDLFLVGRSKKAHLQLSGEDRFFSRFHFLVEVNPPRCHLKDMKSRNGTHVNGQRVTAIDLHDGDRIKAGHTILQVAIEDNDPSLKPPSLPATLPPPPPPHEPPQVAASARGQPQPGTLDPFASLNPWLATHRPPARPGLRPCPTCPICGLSAAPSSAGPAQDRSGLCSDCQEEANAQPQPIPGYRIVRELGSGAMGIVYHALCLANGTGEAVKVIKPAGPMTPDDAQRFLREARILEQLHHPGIVAFREMGEAKGQLYFAMEYVRGTDGWDLLGKQGPLPVPLAVKLICQVLDALAHAHAKDFVHRDVKPANILITGAVGHEIAKLADFGLARKYQSSSFSGMTLPGQVGGTIAFIPPEQITHFREAKPPVDQYSTAATLYTLLTNKCVFDFPETGTAHESHMARIEMILNEPPVPIRSRRKDVSKGLAQVIHRALAKEPTDRFAGVQTLCEALSPFS